MGKILVILLIVVLAVVAGIGFVINKVRKMFGSMSQPNMGQEQQPVEEAENKNVIYNKRDVVVMKGEAGQKKENPKNMFPDQ